MRVGLIIYLLAASIGLAGDPFAVPTFNNMSLYWKTDGSADLTCEVEFKKASETEWNQALDLWWAGDEYRGSVLNLEAGTEYQFRISRGGKHAIVNQRTWSEVLPIASTRSVTNRSKTFEVRNGGNERDGYVVYDFSNATVDVGYQQVNCVRIEADYVIVRGGQFLNAAEEAILIGKDTHHVVVEGVTVEAWGSRAKGYEVSDRIGGIAMREGCAQIVIQGCRIGNPRYDAWDWTGGFGAPAGEDHPHGAFAIACPDEPSGLSNNVIRYNHLYGTPDRRLEDGMGAFSGNFSDQGFPGADSDIYGNHIEYCVDNGIEAEGGGKNIRVYENYLDQVYTPLGTKAVSLGPAFFVRNVGWRSLPVKGRSMKFIKAGGEGMRYFFHNLTLSDALDGYNRGLDTEGAYLDARNNVFVVCEDGIGNKPFSIGSSDSENCASNLVNGDVILLGSEKTVSLKGFPNFRIGHGPGNVGRFQLAEGSLGYDAGVVIPNVNDGFLGAAPDVGAHEAGTEDMVFGPEGWKR